MLTILAGLCSAFSYATSDLLSQNVARRTRPLTQVVWIFAVGTLVSVPVALIVDGVPVGAEWRGAAFSAVAGALYFLDLYCLLRGLHAGDLGLISALNALNGAYVVVVAILMGEPVTPVLGTALALCVVGGVLTSMEGRATTTKGAFWGLASGGFLACTVLAFSAADSISPVSQTAIARTVSLVIALALALASGGVAMPRGLRGRASVAALLELAGLALLTLAFFLGPLAVAGVTSAQLGTFAVILGFTILHERPRRHQWIGIACTLSGVSLLASVG